MSRIGANAFKHFRRATLRSAPSSSRCPRDMSLRIRSHCISARRTLRCRRNGLSRCFAVMSQFESLLSTDTVEKLRKRIAVKFRPNDILSENRCSMPPQCGYGGRLLLQRQLPRPPQIFFRFSSPRLYKLWLIAENRVFQHWVIGRLLPERR